MKKIILILLVTTAANNVFGQIWVKESDIPAPEIQHELPEALIGEFIVASYWADHRITIFPSNKYIISFYVPGHKYEESYGHIVKINDALYFSELGHYPQHIYTQGYFDNLTEIQLTDSGFSYFLGEFELLSKRKDGIPAPVNLAKDISVSERIVKRQYFSFNNSETDMFEYNEIDPFPHNYGYPTNYTHLLKIDNGIIKISRCLMHSYRGDSIDREAAYEFIGFIEITEESTDVLNGIIRFTNGLPYYYTEDGTAEIKINSDNSVIVTMFYTPDQIEPYMFRARPRPDGFKFPAKLTLEF